MLEELAPGGRAPLPEHERQARGRPTHYYMPFFVNFTRDIIKLFNPSNETRPGESRCKVL